MLQENYYVVEAEVSDIKDLSSICEVALTDFGCDGVEEFSYDEAMVDDVLKEKAFCWSNIPEDLVQEIENHQDKNLQKHLFYFYTENFELRSKKFFEHLQQKYPQHKFQIKLSPVDDWDKKWREFYKPIKISDDISIIPSWMKSDQKGAVFIYPGQGFGTGGHETTMLCLKFFDEIKDNFKEKFNCLDLGCGSGILGIVVLKHADANVAFCDVDKGALDNTLQNIELNLKGKNLTGSSIVLRDRLPAGQKYNLIFANILINVLTQEADFIMDSLADGGSLILSGILDFQEDDIKARYNRLNIVNRKEHNNWVSILFQK